ncbi:polymer-forming cytoskeletal protein [Aceticella autotrophica]|uniref:Polymer-forming cytoskeletal protein n=1 Tax=Aceticella autotrophica TaxID=2755338 RepID=A0A975GAX7_9THEO|nr:polymer-forming cytoskeletal protein [Aceticella autotrophica]QSZ27848.1 polymer-forming cytoskeletal protein [Aceticella autotrophica]
MFKKKNNFDANINTDKIETIIGKNTNLEGNLKSQGTIRIDGNFNGKIDVDGNIIVGENSKIEADITTDNISISGEIKGNLIVKGQAQLTSTAKLFGDIEVQNIIIDDGAIFEGKCKMTNSEISLKKEEIK